TILCKSSIDAPNHHSCTAKINAPHAIATMIAAEEKHRSQAERDGHDRLTEITLILVLMQREARTRGIAVDEAAIRLEAFEPRFGRGLGSKTHEHRRQCRPRALADRIECFVPIAAPVRDPADASAIGHCNGPAKAAGGDQVA